ncbi:hypothetical protein TrST_g3535 [Triparma strigata]|uniref:Uncharacterized protein n=1 Tax=Triparma strigata TaxID=1606541 RepID=A0A9W7EGS9_9STRA|nr:hypothetical protein TrST_g3535 [Triparma strigata]
MELPTWETSSNVNASRNDLSFATASSAELGLNTSVHRRGTLLQSMSQPLVTHSQVSFGAHKLNESLTLDASNGRPPPASSNSSLRSFKGSSSSSNHSVTSAISTSPSLSSSKGGTNPPQLPVADGYQETGVDSSYIGESHYWAGQQERLRATDQALATSSAALGRPSGAPMASPGPFSKSKKQHKSSKSKSARTTQTTPKKSPSKGNNTSAVRTSPIERSLNGSESSGETDENVDGSNNNNNTNNSTKRASPSASTSRRSSNNNNNNNVSFGMPQQFQRGSPSHNNPQPHAAPPPPSPSPYPVVDSSQMMDFLDFLTSGLEQTITSIEALVVSEQSTAAIVYRDKPLNPSGTSSGHAVAPPAYDPAAITRLRNFVGSYLMGHNPSTESGALSFGRSSRGRSKRDPPPGPMGRSLGELRSLIVDTLSNSLNLCEAARRSAAVERRQCREHMEKMQMNAATMARKLGSNERAKRKKLEKENKALHKNLAEDLENTIRDRTVGYETRNAALEDEINTLKMELSWMKNENKKREEEHANALEYAKYRSTTDVSAMKQSEIEALRLQHSHLEQKFKDYEKETVEKLNQVKLQEKENQLKENQIYLNRINEMTEKLKSSEDRRIEQEKRAKQVLTEEVAKLRSSHQEAINSFRDRTYKNNSASAESLESERRRHAVELEHARSEASNEIEGLRAAMELIKAEGRDNVREARQEAEARAGREARDQVRALTSSHEAEMRRAGKEVVRLQKLLKKKGVSAGVSADAFPTRIGSDPSDDELDAFGSVAPTATKKTRSGKIASGGGIAPTWLKSIDKGGEDLNVAGGRGGGKGRGSSSTGQVDGPVTSILRRSSELREKVVVPPSWSGTGGGSKVVSDPVGPSGSSSAPAPRSSSPPIPTKSSSTSLEVKNVQRNAPLGHDKLSVSQWQETLNLKESKSGERKKRYETGTAVGKLDDYVTQNP